MGTRRTPTRTQRAPNAPQRAPTRHPRAPTHPTRSMSTLKGMCRVKAKLANFAPKARSILGNIDRLFFAFFKHFDSLCKLSDPLRALTCKALKAPNKGHDESIPGASQSVPEQPHMSPTLELPGGLFVCLFVCLFFHQ